MFYTSDPVLSEQPDQTGVRQILRGGMWPSQRKWWELDNFVKCFVGGYGAGKSLALSKRMVFNAGRNSVPMRRTRSLGKEWWRDFESISPPIRNGIVSPSYSVAKETVLVSIESILLAMEHWCSLWRQNADLEPRWIGHHIRRSAPYEVDIYFKRGRRPARMGRIIILSGDNPEMLKGPNLATAGIDEPFIQDYGVFEQMHARCRHPGAAYREIVLTGTPEGVSTWGYDLAEGDLAHKYNVGLVTASTVENKALPEDYIQRLYSSLDPKAQQVYIHGHFVNLAEGLVYYAFDRSESVVDLDMPLNAEIGVGMDFNVNPMAAVVFWYFKNGDSRHIHFFDEIELPNSDTVEMCSLLNDLYGEKGINKHGGIVKPFSALNSNETVAITQTLRTIYPDSNAGRATNAPGGKTDYDYIKEAGFELDKRASGNPLLKDRFNTVNNMLRPVGGRVRMTFSPRCKKLIKYQLLYSHEERNKHEQKQMSHLLDARDYPVCRLFPVETNDLRFTPLKGF